MRTITPPPLHHSYLLTTLPTCSPPFPYRSYYFESSSFKPNKHFIAGTTLVLLALGLYGASA